VAISQHSAAGAENDAAVQESKELHSRIGAMKAGIFTAGRIAVPRKQISAAIPAPPTAQRRSMQSQASSAAEP